VGVAALEHDAVLVSRDRRAWQTYQRLRVQVELLP
jgi:phosphohistidine phosphatase SixA